jgi:hypothetical protein
MSSIDAYTSTPVGQWATPAQGRPGGGDANTWPALAVGLGGDGRDVVDDVNDDDEGWEAVPAQSVMEPAVAPSKPAWGSWAPPASGGGAGRGGGGGGGMLDIQREEEVKTAREKVSSKAIKAEMDARREKASSDQGLSIKAAALGAPRDTLDRVKAGSVSDAGGGASAGAEGGAGGPGRAVQVHPMKPKLKPPGTKLLKLKCELLL